jgi:hypothetical protein
MSHTRTLLLIAGLALATAGCTAEKQDEIGAIPASSRAKALQVEAQQMLRQIYSMQQTYYAINKQYGADFASLGIEIPPTARYRYQLTARGSSWNCNATANIDQDATIDTWIVDQSGRVTCATNDAVS